jgi:hypothetical protein
LRQGLNKGRAVEKVREKSEPKSRSSWKTLRDFVDDQAIDDVLENIENDRLRLDVCYFVITTSFGAMQTFPDFLGYNGEDGNILGHPH